MRHDPLSSLRVGWARSTRYTLTPERVPFSARLTQRYRLPGVCQREDRVLAAWYRALGSPRTGKVYDDDYQAPTIDSSDSAAPLSGCRTRRSRRGTRSMIDRLMIISGVILAGTCLPAQAQMTLDVSKITCDQFVGYKITNPRNIALWLSGYYNGKRGNTIIDTQELEQNSEKVQDYCRLNPKMPVMQAVEAVFDLR
jgi:acid stress chaperone HdeB